MWYSTNCRSWGQTSQLQPASISVTITKNSGGSRINKVHILVPGYAQINPDSTWNATCTTTLIETDTKHRIIMDPGCDRPRLLASLAEKQLEVGVIDLVFISHYHPDHCLLIGIFPNATVVDSLQWQKGPIGGEVGEYLPDTDIKIVKTPGHAPEHASLLVPTLQGQVLISADVFWWKDGETPTLDIDHPDEFASDTKNLQKSRTLALEISDLIIPGHGPMLRTPKK